MVLEVLKVVILSNAQWDRELSACQGGEQELTRHGSFALGRRAEQRS